MNSPEAVWLDAPCAALHAWHHDGVACWRLNAAARHGPAMRHLDDQAWAGAAAALLQAAAQAREGTLEVGAAALGWRAVPLANGTLFWLEPRQPPRAEVDAVDRLALVQGFGRMGFFERELGGANAGWWDPHAFRLFGLPPAPQAPAWEVALQRVHPDDRVRLNEYQRQHLSRPGRHEIRYRLRLPDGTQRAIHALTEVQPAGPGRLPRVLGVLIDDTESAARERTLRVLSEERAQAMELAAVSVWRIDLATGRIELNQAGYDYLGLTPAPGGMLLDDMRARIHPDDGPALRAAFDRALATDAVVDAEGRYRHADGTWRHLLTRRVAVRDDAGRPIALTGISLDVTQQRALHLELQLQAERLRLAAHSAGVGIWDRDVATGHVVWEEQMYRLRGLSPDDARSPREIDSSLCEPAAYAERARLVERHLRDFQPYEFEFAVRWPDGSLRWLATTGRAVRDAEGRPVRMVGLNWDVTQRRLAEVALRDAQAAERASQAKSEFLARVSHELRTPLNAMLGFAHLMLRDADGAALAPLQRERAERIRSAGEHLLGLIDEVLDLTAVEAGRQPLTLQSVALDAVVDEVLPWVAPIAKERQVALHAPASGACVLADARRLRQVLANLFSNAVKYNRRGGQVWLGARPLRCEGVDGWQISVRDTGRGFDAEQRAHLFEPFNRLGAEREPIEGRGIGLATVRQLVQRMGGRLEVESRPGQGSEFDVWLPGATPAPTPPHEGRPRCAAASGAALSVLYVEDNPVNVMVVQELLALRPGVRFASAGDGCSGVAAALRDAPDLVLLDIHLPDIDGLEALRRLRDGGYRGPCYALSANAMPADVARARAAGFDAYWTKPLDFERFLAALDLLAAAATTTTTNQE